MKIKEMLKTLPKKEKRQPLTALDTIWGETLDPDHILEEYPRPQMMRSQYVILNGYWQYAITASGKYPKNFDGLILVPFSPESLLSGLMNICGMNGRSISPTIQPIAAVSSILRLWINALIYISMDILSKNMWAVISPSRWI